MFDVMWWVKSIQLWQCAIKAQMNYCCYFSGEGCFALRFGLLHSLLIFVLLDFVLRFVLMFCFALLLLNTLLRICHTCA